MATTVGNPTISHFNSPLKISTSSVSSNPFENLFKKTKGNENQLKYAPPTIINNRIPSTAIVPYKKINAKTEDNENQIKGVAKSPLTNWLNTVDGGKRRRKSRKARKSKKARKSRKN
jgi:hypothetical protein